MARSILARTPQQHIVRRICWSCTTISYNLPPDIELLYPAQFGHNLVLTPHTYLMTGAAALTDTLYLNAQGVANAVFVIKVAGALSTSTFANVILTNGTQAANVFWNVEGAVSVSDYSMFKGTIVCNNGAIDLTTGVVLDGRALTTTGAVGTTAMTATIPPLSCNIAPLPLGWLYFTGKAVQDNVLLEWGVTGDMNTGIFTVEKSSDGQKYDALAIVNATHLAGQPDARYSIVDDGPLPIGYYSVRHTGLDGLSTYFNTIRVNTGNDFSAVAYVRNNRIYVQIAGTESGSGFITLYSSDGRKITSEEVQLTKGSVTYQMDKPWQKGVYFVHIASQGKKLSIQKMLVN